MSFEALLRPLNGATVVCCMSMNKIDKSLGSAGPQNQQRLSQKSYSTKNLIFFGPFFSHILRFFDGLIPIFAQLILRVAYKFKLKLKYVSSSQQSANTVILTHALIPAVRIGRAKRHPLVVVVA